MFDHILKRLHLRFVILLGLLVRHKELAASKTGSIFYLTVPSLETFSFQCQDQMVKVNSNIYHLDRLRSSLKSNYFEKLLTSGDFELKNDKVLEIQPKHGEMFPYVVDLIHGKKLIDVLSKDNYLTLLEAMDHLGLEIDLEVVCTFIDDNLKLYSPQDMKILQLYNFIRKNSKFEYLLHSVFKYFSDNLRTVYTREILASVPLNHLIRMITWIEKVDDEKKREIIQTCTEWLYHDLKNRLPLLVILINSIKPKFHSAEESNKNNSTLTKCGIHQTNVDDQTYKKSISSCLFALLAYGGKLNPTILRRDDLSAGHFGLPSYETYENEVYEKRAEYDEYEENGLSTSANSNNEYNKLKKFLKNGSFYDIRVRAGEKEYKLHRAVLESRCGYFADIFRTEYNESVAKCNGIPATFPYKDEEYLLDGVDQSTFDAVIDHVYFDKDIRNEFNDTPRVFKAADILKIDSLLKVLKVWLEDSCKEVSSQDVVEVMNGAYGKMQYEDLYLISLCKHISTKWPELDNMSQFCSISCPMLENMLMSSQLRLDDPHKILDICSTWIIHDVTNRYRFLPRIAKAVTHYLSPMEDGGYDITDFTAINPLLGTMEDFDELVEETKGRGMKLIVDIVINHSSDKHPWFIKSINKEGHFTDYYVWRNPKGYDFSGKPIPPNNWVSIFKGSAWTWNEQRRQFYLRQFSCHQPDFNLRNNFMKDEIKKIFEFWLNKGISGFRIDATKYLIEDAEFRDDPVMPGVIVPYTYHDVTHLYTADLWETYQFIHEIRMHCDEISKKFTDYERILLPEAYGGGKMLYQYYSTKDYKISHFPLNFAFVLINDYRNASSYHNLINNYLSPMPEGATPTWNSENHDKYRKAMGYNPEYEYIFTTMVMLLPGVAYIYYGQEIGMIGARIRKDQQRDTNPDDFTQSTRDSSRLPMQWDDSFNAGFSTNPKTYLPVSPEYWKINVKKQKSDPNSHYYIFKKMLDLRKTDVFKYGGFKSYVISTWVLGFTRTLKGRETFLVVLNLGSETEIVNLSSVIHDLPESMNVELASPNSGYKIGDEILTSATVPKTFILRPFGVMVLSSKSVGSE